MARIIREVRPRYVFVENSPMLTSRGLGRVLGDLAEMGYDARWGVLGACDTGAPHKRDRIWILADSSFGRRSEPCCGEGKQQGRAESVSAGQNVADTSGERQQGGKQRRTLPCDGEGAKTHGSASERRCTWWDHDPADVGDPDSINGRAGTGRQDGAKVDNAGRRPTQPVVGRVANGVAHRVDRLKAIGNGQVSSVAALAWRILSQ